MTNRERFYEAFAHTQHVVFGRKLQRFTLRHRFWLETLECSAVVGGNVDWPSIELAVRVCSMPFAQLDDGVRRLLARGPRWWEAWVFMWRAWRGDLRAEYTALLAYMEDHGCAPVRTSMCEGNEGDGMGVMPGLLSLVTGVVRASGGWEPDTVWALSPGEAEWYCTACYMHRGVDMGLKTEHDEAFEKGLAEHGEEIRKYIAEQKRKRAEAHGLTPDPEYGEQPDKSHSQCAGAADGAEPIEEPVGGLCGDIVGADRDLGERRDQGASTVERSESGLHGEGAGTTGIGSRGELRLSRDDETIGGGVEGAGDDLGGHAGAHDDSVPPITREHGASAGSSEGADAIHGEDALPPGRNSGSE